ncbi:hypothetical protein Ddye_013401 [Dipteronia dyeriana]|uniref:Uncharacterized protein n=1 Tax=Dipteronia dyeriana TaxID=168575 RepID=A0AAE0CJL1_9ROSI|nr:hypothetical protein Ddye_013401 [Dipteronia dyeriana]
MVVWTIWEVRNNKVFNNVDTTISKTEDMVRFRVVWWFKYLGGGSSYSITHMLLNIKECCSNSRKMKVPKKDEWVSPPVDALKLMLMVRREVIQAWLALAKFFVIMVERDSNSIVDFMAHKRSRNKEESFFWCD